MGEVPKHIVVGHVAQLSHILGQLVGQLVERFDREGALAVGQPQKAGVELCEKVVAIGSLAWNAAAALATFLVGEGDASEEAVGQILLVELTRHLGRRGEGDVDAQNGVARHALCRGAQRSSPLLVVDVAHHLAHLPVASEHAVGHLHFGQVDKLRPSAQLLQRHGVLQEGRVGHVGGWIPKGHVGPFGLFLVGPLGLHLSLPIDELLKLRLVVLAKTSHHGLYKTCELCLADARRAYQMTHLSASLIEVVVRVLELDASNQRGHDGNDHRGNRFAHLC